MAAGEEEGRSDGPTTTIQDEQDGGGEQGQSFLPPFANAENRALDVHVRALEQQLQQLDLELEDHDSRIGVMQDHMKNVQQEITYTESRVEAERKEIETEEHLKAMADKEASRVRSDLGRLERERVELRDRIAGLQGDIFKGSEKLDQFKAAMNWNQEELDQWAVAQRQKEEDNQALEKYRRQDQARLKELGLAVEKLTQQVAAAKEALEAESTDTLAMQTQLERAAHDFRRLHAERQELIRQWDEAREAVRHRDEAIQEMATAFAEHKVRLKQKQAELDAQARLLAGEQASNRELDAQVSQYEREMGKAREAQMAEAAKLEELANQVELMQGALSKTTNDLAAANAANRASRAELETKRQRLELVRKKHAALKQQLEGECGQLDTMEAKVSRLEALRKREQAGLRALQSDREALAKDLFRAGQALHALRARERELVGEISGAQSQGRNLDARLRALDEQLARQAELVYTVDFNLQEVERRISRAGGHRSDDEARALAAHIVSLTEQLEGVSREHALLVEQVKQAELDLGEARRANTGLLGEKRRLGESAQALQLETDSTARALKAAIADKERQLVDHDVLKLQVHRLRQLLAMAADEVFTLEGRRAALSLSLDERRLEIQVQRDALRAELKLVREDVHRLTLELRERQARVGALGSKFEALAAKGRGAAGEDGGEEPHSQAYFVVKAAQEREELQMVGDALDAKITQAEAEVAALSSTLAQMQATNTAFSTSLRQGDTKATAQERAALRQHLDARYDELKALREQEAVLLAEEQQQQASCSSSDAELAGMQAAADELARSRAEAERLLEEQREKEARAQRAMQRAQKLLATQASMSRAGSAAGGAAGAGTGGSRGGARLAAAGESRGSSAAGGRAAGGRSASAGSAASGRPGGPPALDPAELELDVRLAEARHVTRTMMQELGTLAQQHPGAGIAQALVAAGLKLPAASAGAPGSRAGSVAASRAASRAGSIQSQPSRSSLDGGGVAPPAKSAGATAAAAAAAAGRIGSFRSMSFGAGRAR